MPRTSKTDLPAPTTATSSRLRLPLLAIAATLCLLLLAACGSDDEPAEEADGHDGAATLALATAAANLEAESGRVVDALAEGDVGPDAAGRRIERVERRATRLIEDSERPTSFEVEIDELNGSGVGGRADVSVDVGDIGVDIDVEGLSAERDYGASLHGGPDDGDPARCPSGQRAASLSAQQGERSYGPRLVPFPSIEGGTGSRSVAAGRDPDNRLPTSEHVLVITGGELDGRFEPELPIACGELAGSGGDDPDAAIIGAVEQVRVGVAELEIVARRPASDAARDALRLASDRFLAANGALRDALRQVLELLDEEGALTDDDRRAVEAALSNLEQAEGNLERLLTRLERRLADERRAERQRREAERQPEPEPAPAPQPQPAPEPPPPAPAPAPAPAPPPENGLGGPENGLGGPDCSPGSPFHGDPQACPGT